MNVYIILRTADGAYYTQSNVLSFSFSKDLYTPYTTLTAHICTSSPKIPNIAEITLNVNGFPVHHGLIDSVKQEKKGNCRFISISSRGFTSLLCQNQIEPGLKMNISFNMLMEDFYTLPYVFHENDSDNSSYIYVKPNTSMWDAAANLTYKRRGTYPYIRGTNTVMMSPVTTPVTFDYSGEKFISTGIEHVNSRLGSDYHMADINGDYGNFDLSDSDVSDLKIVRHKYFDLDMRFLYAPQQALVYRDKYDFRGRERVFCSYNGYHGEDLCDIVSFDSVSSERVGSVTIRGSSKGIFTEVGVYRDKFPHISPNA
ncbi:MAG: hypothetical protein IKW96_11935 [Ruminococcus sp.]|uniref:hypothetical protein n=1 Tax=Ruminococcus sp. TaxID=41978 RepID=UPI0025F9CC7D|nr:hypothetical protein [Ruminococcus sp.]MBR5683964.1 hypothetical protein [Ruminococcus sp.]